MAGALAQLLAIGDVPVLDQLVIAAGHEEVALGVKGDGVNHLLMGVVDLACDGPLGDIPDPRSLVVATGGRELAVRAPRDAVDLARVAGEGFGGAGRRPIPNLGWVWSWLPDRICLPSGE